MNTPIQLKISQLINDLNRGFVRLKSQDTGSGSIEAKYGMEAWEVERIFLHPSLKNVQTRPFRFELIDDSDLTIDTDRLINHIVEIPAQEILKGYPAQEFVTTKPPVQSTPKEEVDYAGLL